MHKHPYSEIPAPGANQVYWGSPLQGHGQGLRFLLIPSEPLSPSRFMAERGGRGNRLGKEAQDGPLGLPPVSVPTWI